MYPLGSLAGCRRAAWPGGVVGQEPELRAVALGTYLGSSGASLPAVYVSIYYLFCSFQHFTPVTTQLLCALQAALNKGCLSPGEIMHQICLLFLSSTCKVCCYLGVSSKAPFSGVTASVLVLDLSERAGLPLCLQTLSCRKQIYFVRL